VRGVKALTSKPVVGVGRFTSPDTMVRMVRQGVLDFIGAARPSIADLAPVAAMVRALRAAALAQRRTTAR